MSDNGKWLITKDCDYNVGTFTGNKLNDNQIKKFCELTNTTAHKDTRTSIVSLQDGANDYQVYLNYCELIKSLITANWGNLSKTITDRLRAGYIPYFMPPSFLLASQFEVFDEAIRRQGIQPLKTDPTYLLSDYKLSGAHHFDLWVSRFDAAKVMGLGDNIEAVRLLTFINKVIQGV